MEVLHRHRPDVLAAHQRWWQRKSRWLQVGPGGSSLTVVTHTESAHKVPTPEEQRALQKQPQPGLGQEPSPNTVVRTAAEDR